VAPRGEPVSAPAAPAAPAALPALYTPAPAGHPHHAAHLSARLALTPLRDLADCPHVPHHAIGSPLFDDRGRALTPDPVLTLCGAPLADPHLPRMSLAVAPCGARPRLARSPEVRALLAAMCPAEHPQARREVEGLLAAGAARRCPPGALAGHLDGVLLLGVEGAAPGSEVWRAGQAALAEALGALPQGSSVRLPLLRALDLDAAGRGLGAEARALLLDGHLIHLAVAALERPAGHEGVWTPRRVLLCEPAEERARWALGRLASRALLLSLVDKLRLSVVSPLLTLGVVAGGGEEGARLVDEGGFEEALGALDAALDALLRGEGREALRLGAYAVSAEPALAGVFSYVERLAAPGGVPSVLLGEVLRVGREGRLLEARPLLDAAGAFALSPAQAAQHAALEGACERLARAELRARLDSEEYARAEEWVARCESLGLRAPCAAWREEARRRPAEDARLVAARARRDEGAPPGDEEEPRGESGARWRSLALWGAVRGALAARGGRRARALAEGLGEGVRWALAAGGRAEAGGAPPAALLEPLGGELCALVAALALLSHDSALRERALAAWRAWLRAAEDEGPWARPAVPLLPEQREALNALSDQGAAEAPLPHCGDYARLAAARAAGWREAVEAFADLLAAAESRAEPEALRSRYARWREALADPLSAPLGAQVAATLDALLGEPWLRREAGRPQTGIQIPTFLGELSLDLLIALWGRWRRLLARRRLRGCGVAAQLDALSADLLRAAARAAQEVR